MRQYIDVSHGVIVDVGKKHHGMCNEISHMVNNWGRNILNQRNQATQARHIDLEKIKNASLNEDKLKTERDKLKGELSLSTQHEKLLEERIEFYKERVDGLKEKADSLSEESERFHEHHRALCKRYEDQDVQHHNTIRVSIPHYHNMLK